MDAILSVYYNLMEKSSPSLKVKGKKLDKIIDKYYEDGLVGHFSENGWDLSVDSMVQDILFEAFGVHVSDIITSKLHEKLDCDIRYTNELVFSKKGGFSPVYYDMWEDKLIVIPKEEAKNKSYIFNYREKDGYEFIGCL
jgi:hypothetical protein